MKYITDTALMAESGLLSPYTTSAPMHSPITGQSVMTHRVFPGLGCFLVNEQQSEAILYMNEIEAINEIVGVLYLTTRASIDDPQDKKEYWLIQIESGYQAWQFMASMDSVSLLSNYITVCEWIPGSLNEALTLHDTTISELWDEDDLLIGSDLEKKSLSRFALASGATSIFHPLLVMGFVKEARNAQGRSIQVESGGCSRMRSLPITWHKIA